MQNLGLVNFENVSGAVEVREVEVPQINDDEVLFEVKAVSVCGSDLHQWHGTQSWQVNYPVILGHEFSGVVAKVGM
jgi:L-iditol 2-dehydrogenase